MNKADISRAFLDMLGRDAEESAVSFYEKKQLSYEELCEVIKESLEYRKKNPDCSASQPKLNELHKNSFLAYPKPQLFVVQPLKVLYCPIAKNACSSLKRLMVEISDIPEKNEVLSGDVHERTDGFNTGIQLKDLDEHSAKKALTDPTYYRFAVLRDPFSRLLSAYWEKMVVNRLMPDNLKITRAVLEGVARIERAATPSPEKGITFKQFIRYVSNTAPEELDPHWRHQFKYLEDLDIQWLYNQKNLQPLYDKLSDICGYEISRNKSNVTNSGQGEVVDHAYNLLPNDLLLYKGVDKKSFLSADIESAIQSCYKKDYELLNQCQV